MPEADPRPRAFSVRAPAKVNLYLEVLGRRGDGYHELWTVMQAVSLCDELTFAPRSDGRIEFRCSAEGVPRGEENLVVRAARLLQERHAPARGADVTLRKRIPVGGGLGGGSTDAAVTLMALADLWKLRLPADELAALAGRLGSDVPFFIRGGTAVCEGRGERVRPVACPRPMHYVLVAPRVHCSTSRVYAACGSALTGRGEGRRNVVKALNGGNAALLASSFRNDLQAPAFALYQDLQQLWEDIEAAKPQLGFEGTVLSGSGAGFLVAVGGQKQAGQVAARLAATLGVPCWAVRSLPAWDGSILPLRAARRHL